MEVKEFENTKRNIKDALRFAWLFVPYNAEVRKFRLALHILPMRIVEPTFTYKQYPEVDKFIKENIIPKYPCETALAYSGLEFTFDKRFDDYSMADVICGVNKELENFGILHSGIIMVYRGVPDLTYGQEYLEYTTSVKNMNIMGLADLLSMGSEATMERIAKEIPISSEQKFNPDVNTDVSHADSLLFKKLENLTNRMKLINDVTDVIEKAFKDVASVPTKAMEPKETYSSEDSDEYSNFQSHWI